MDDNAFFKGTQAQRLLDHKIANRKRLIELRSERREAARRAPVKITITLSAETRDQAERACALTQGVSLATWFNQAAKTFADMPEGRIPDKEKKRKGYIFTRYEDRVLQEQIATLLEETKEYYPNGIKMSEVIHLHGVIEGTRGMLTIIGRIMKNLGYIRHRTYITKTDGEPAHLGWIYRKEEQMPWLPNGA